MGGTGDGIFLYASRRREEARQKIIFRHVRFGRYEYPDRMAEITIQSLVDYFDGKQPEKLIKIPAKLYYKEDADKDPDLK